MQKNLSFQQLNPPIDTDGNGTQSSMSFTEFTFFHITDRPGMSSHELLEIGAELKKSYTLGTYNTAKTPKP